MVVKGHVENGQVILDQDVSLPEGAQIELRVVAPKEDEGEDTQDEGEVAPEIPSLLERLKSVVGVAEGLPSDLAKNHDHYLYGAPKK